MCVDSCMRQRRLTRRNCRFPAQPQKICAKTVKDLFVPRTTCHRHYNAVRSIAMIQITEKIGPLETGNRGSRTRDWSAERMPTPVIEMKQIVNEIVRRVFDLGNLLADY